MVGRTLKRLLRPLMPRAIRAWRILGGPLRGMHIVTSWHDYPAAILGRTEVLLLRWFESNARPGETWLDIGAHYGYTAIALCRIVGPSGRVFAFEPMVSTAGYLAQTRRLNCSPQLTVLPLALAAPVGDMELQQLPTVRGMVDSIIRRETRDNSSFSWHETMLVARLDWLWPRLCGGHERIDGVKIDVQGMEIEVLRGMTDTLKRQRPKLVVEVHPGVNRAGLLELLEGLGYSRLAMPIEPVAGEVEPQYVDDRSYVFKSV